MQYSDKGFRERQKKLIRQRTQMVIDYRAKHLDEKTRERFRRPAYSACGKSLFGVKGHPSQVEKKEGDNDERT